MINIQDYNYKIQEDISFFTSAALMTWDELSKNAGVSKEALYRILHGETSTQQVLEKTYSFIYNEGYRLNAVKEEIQKELSNKCILFHGSKYGLTSIDIEGARQNCDFGKGFYLGENYQQAVSFVVDNEKSSVYSFELDIQDLNVVKFEPMLEWMLAICYYRGNLDEYSQSAKIQNIVSKVESADVVVAPIADNRMFYIMSLFIQGEINADAALHSLSASKLGMQYVMKTEKALQKLTPIEKYYISEPERKQIAEQLQQRVYEIDTKLKMSKREFRNGLYIEEILK